MKEGDRVSDEQARAVRKSLLELAHSIAGFEEMAILGEGNISGKLDAERFLIKASGTQLGTLIANQLVEVESPEVLKSLESESTNDENVESLLLASRVDPESLKPSVETLFHAWLLELPGIDFVGHTHPIHVNQLLCSPRSNDFAQRRLFPDQIVYCGMESVFVPYVDPGMTLARRIAREVQEFRERTNCMPKTILLENHGLIAIGGTAKQVEASLFMTEKAATLFMPDDQVQRIAARSDEHYRQRMLETNP